MDGVKRRDKIGTESHRIGLDELQRIPGSRYNINADDIESSVAIANTSTPGATEQIEDPGAP